jgi:SAM-dependent methyltransferase
MKYAFHDVRSCNMCGGSARVFGRRLSTSQGLLPKSKIGISVTVMRCARCGLIYPNPMPIPESIEDHYGIPPEDYWREDYFTVPDGNRSVTFDRMRDLAPHAKTFLDIGAGIGKTMKVAREREGLEAYGVEPSEPFHRRAIELMGIPAERIALASAESAEFPDESFDLISFGVVLEHLYDPSAALLRALRWLKPGGVIHVEVPNAAYILSKLFNLYFWLRGTDFVVNISPMHVPFHLYEFTTDSFVRNGEINGYAIAHVDHFAGVSSFAPRLNKLLTPAMDATGTGLGIVLYLTRA